MDTSTGVARRRDEHDLDLVQPRPNLGGTRLEVNANTPASEPRFGQFAIAVSHALTLANPCARLARPRRPCVTSKKGKPLDFEQALAELEAVVERLEHGELPLEDALKQFERGIELAHNCQSSLKQAEQRVEILLKKTPDAEPEPFEGSE